MLMTPVYLRVCPVFGQHSQIIFLTTYVHMRICMFIYLFIDLFLYVSIYLFYLFLNNTHMNSIERERERHMQTYITSHFITWHYITSDYNTLQSSTWHFIALHCIAMHTVYISKTHDISAEFPPSMLATCDWDLLSFTKNCSNIIISWNNYMITVRNIITVTIISNFTKNCRDIITVTIIYINSSNSQFPTCSMIWFNIIPL